jgi:hypothetical protein
MDPAKIGMTYVDGEGVTLDRRTTEGNVQVLYVNLAATLDQAAWGRGQSKRIEVGLFGVADGDTANERGTLNVEAGLK